VLKDQQMFGRDVGKGIPHGHSSLIKSPKVKKFIEHSRNSHQHSGHRAIWEEGKENIAKGLAVSENGLKCWPLGYIEWVVMEDLSRRKVT
jgi:hypothetical protein